MPVFNHRWPKAPKTYPGNTPAEIVDHIKVESPPSTIKHPIQSPLSATQIQSVVSELECSICHGVLTQPMQLPCDRLVCATCLIEWIHVTAARCPAVIPVHAWSACKLVNPAPKLIQQLLHDVRVWCESWMSSIYAIDYDSHCCSTVKKHEMQLVSKVVTRCSLLSRRARYTGETVSSNVRN